METWVAAIISASALDRDRKATLVVDRESYSEVRAGLKSAELAVDVRKTRIGRMRSVVPSLTIQFCSVCRRANRQRRLLSFVASQAKACLRRQ